MEKKEHLNEENYQKTKKKIIIVALIVLTIGLLIGGSLISKGLKKQEEINFKYSDENKLKISEQIAIEKQNLEAKKSELEVKGVKYSVFTKYTDGEAYDLKIITEVLDPSRHAWSQSEYEENTLTSKYCALKNQLDEISRNRHHDFEYIPFYMFGGFIIFFFCVIAGSIYSIAKGREITAFSAQQVMPVAQEGIEKMAPSVGNVAKEIAKGIKEGLDDNQK